MKKFLTFVLVLAMVLSVSSVAMAADCSINSADDLLAFATAVNAGDNFAGKVVELKTNIDLGGAVWTPIKSFAGEFNGNGYTISNFQIDATASNAGFFGTIEAGDGERVHDLTLSDITATVGAYRFGTLANYVCGIVNRVTVKNVTVTTTHTNAWVGGMCAFMSWPWMNDCTVENLTVNAAAGADLIGGFACILQKNSNMVFDNNDVKGFKVTITDTDSSRCGVGGFVTQTQRGWEYPKVTNSDISGIDITAAGLVDVGGFIAWPGAHTTVEDCTTQGKIDVTGVTSDSCFAGGFFGNLGWNADLGKIGHKVTDCTADVDITTKLAPAGGFVGSATNSNDASMYAEFTNCKAKGDVTSTGTAPVGGFAGDADRGVYTNCTATGTVSGQDYAGGFIGRVTDVDPSYDYRYPMRTRLFRPEQITLDGSQGSYNVTGKELRTGGLIGFVEENTEITLANNSYYIEPIFNPVDTSVGNYGDLEVGVGNTLKEPPAPAPAPKPSGSGISVKYNGGNSFSTSNPSVPTGVEIDGVPVTFNGTGSNFTVGCISSDAKWVTVRWNSTSVTTNFTPDGLVECTTVSIPKTGDMSFWAAVAAFFGF